MALTNVTYAKNPRFAAPRSYWRGVLVGYGPSAVVVLEDNVIHVTEPIPGGVIESFITLDPRFVPWSSNNWTLDHLFTDQYTQINGGAPLYFHATIDLGLLSPDPRFGAGFFFDGATVNYPIFFEPAPSTYWLPEVE